MDTEILTIFGMDQSAVSEALADFTDPIAMLNDCHRRIERFLGVLVNLSRERHVGELGEPARSALAAALHYFDAGAPLHTADEEESLFPRLRVAGTRLYLDTFRHNSVV